MKRILTLVILAALLLSGCDHSEKPTDTVTFYYLRSEIAYGGDDGVIAAEERELAVGELPPSELLHLYLQGPQTEGLVLPLPAGTLPTDVSVDGAVITIAFGPALSGLTDIDLSIACACVGYTCFSATGAETVHVTSPATDLSGPVSYTVTRDTFLLFDDTTVEADAS